MMERQLVGRLAARSARVSGLPDPVRRLALGAGDAGRAVKGSVKQDPTAHKNNMQQWDMMIVAPKPWYAKRIAGHVTWQPHAATVEPSAAGPGDDRDRQPRPARPVAPLFLVKGPGHVSVQDGMTERMVPLPTLFEEDGYVLVDTDPANRTLTGTTDPVDNMFYTLVRSSRILDFLLHDIGALGLPVWRRANGIRFSQQDPAAHRGQHQGAARQPRGLRDGDAAAALHQAIVTSIQVNELRPEHADTGVHPQHRRQDAGQAHRRVLQAGDPSTDPMSAYRYLTRGGSQVLLDGTRAQPLDPDAGQELLAFGQYRAGEELPLRGDRHRLR